MRKDNFQEKPIILAIAFCYVIRLSEASERNQLINIIEARMSLKKGKIMEILEQEQRKYCEDLTIPS